MRETEHLHTFGAKEIHSQKMFAKKRQRMLLPILRVLDTAGVSPDVLSLCGLIAMTLLPFGFTLHPHYILAAYTIHLFCDGTDGALARHMGRASARGAYLDVFVDHAALVATLLVLQWFGIGNPFWVLLYTVGYLILVVHFVIMNARGTPPPFPVARTKYVLFLLVLLLEYGVIGIPLLDLFLRITALYYAVMVGVYAFLLRWSLPS